MKKIYPILFFLLTVLPVHSQDDLMSLLDEDKEDVNYTTATFKSTRIMNGHSIERMPPGSSISGSRTGSERKLVGYFPF